MWSREDGCICNRAEQKDGRNVCACLHGGERHGETERGRGKEQGHINKDLANIMIMFGHNPELLLAGS